MVHIIPAVGIIELLTIATDNSEVIGIGIQLIGTVLALIGLLLILRQIRSSQNDALASSLLSNVNEHWMLLEERRMQIRTGETKVYYYRLVPVLETILIREHDGNLQSLAEAFLGKERAHDISAQKDEVFALIMQEYAVQDQMLNLYEEQYIAARHLQIAPKKLWSYWDSYIRSNFIDQRLRNHWILRQQIGFTFPEFKEFVEKEYLFGKNG